MKLKIISIFFISFILLSNENFKEASYLFNAGLYKEALDKTNKEKHPFFTALAYFRNNEFEKSLTFLDKVDLKKYPFLKNEINYYKASNYYEIGEFEKAYGYLKEITDDFILKKEKDLLFLKISSKIFTDKKEIERIGKRYEKLKLSYPSDMEIKLLLSDLLNYDNKKSEKLLKDILILNPPYSIKDKISKLQSKKNITLKLSLTRKIKKCSNLVKKHKNKEGNLCFDEFINKITTKDKENYCKAHYYYAAALKKRRKHKKAVIEFKKVLKYCPSFEYSDKVNYLAGLSSMMMKDYKGAISFFTKLYKKYPLSNLADDGINYIGFIYSLKKQYRKAEKIYLEQIKKFPGGDTTQDAIWKIAYNYYKQKKYKNYIKFYKSLKKIPQKMYYSKGRLEYWLAKSYENLKLGKKAQSVYLDIISKYHNNYYAFLALMKYKGGIPKRDWSGPKEEESYKIFEDYLKSSGVYEKINYYLKNGLNEFLIYELNFLDRKDKIYLKYKKEISLFFIDAGVYYLPFWHKKLNQKWVSYDIDLKRNKEYLKRLYPKAFYVYVKRNAGKRKISPYLILSIMREESYFNVSIESWANAYGLMQIIEPTAKHLAKNLKIKYKREYLFNPEYNIKLGSFYLSWSSKYFKNKIYYVIPSYNAGLNAVKKWKKQKYGNKVKDFDMFIEDIPYTETRHYTKRVLNSYFIYNMLYEGKIVKLK